MPDPDPTLIHPAAAVWPMLAEDELRALADDIKAHGLIHPIVLTPDGLVLDGRNRLAACELVGVEPTFETHNGDPVSYVLSSNAQRRHVSKGQKAMAAVLTVGVNDLHRNGAIAEKAGVSRPMVVWARTVAEHAPSLVDAVLAPVEPMPLRAAYDEAVKIREAAEGVPSRLARLAKDAPDLADFVRAGTLTLVGAEADLTERRRQRAKIGQDGEHAAAQIGMSLSNVIAVFGAIQAGFDLDPDKILEQLNEAATAFASMLRGAAERDT